MCELPERVPGKAEDGGELEKERDCSQCQMLKRIHNKMEIRGERNEREGPLTVSEAPFADMAIKG